MNTDTDMFNDPTLIISGLEVNNPEEDLVVNGKDQLALDAEDFALMWAEENKQAKPDHSMGLDEPTFDENGFEVDEEDNWYEDADADLEDFASEVNEKRLQENLEQYQAFASSFNELPDDMEFNVNGVTLTKSDLAAVASHNEMVKDSFGFITELQRDLKGSVDAMQHQLHQVQTETSKERQILQAQLRNPSIPQVEKGALYERLQNLDAREKYLTNKAVEFSNQSMNAKKQALQARISSVSQQLSMKYAPDEVSATLSYVTDSGIPQDEMFELSSMPFFEMARKAKAYDELKNKSVSKTSPTKSVKSIKSRARKQTPVKSSNADQLISAWETGNSQNPDAINKAIFDLLED